MLGEFNLPRTVPGLFCVEHTHVLGPGSEFDNEDSVCRKVQAEPHAEKSTLGALCMQKILPELLAPHGSLTGYYNGDTVKLQKRTVLRRHCPVAFLRRNLKISGCVLPDSLLQRSQDKLHLVCLGLDQTSRTAT